MDAIIESLEKQIRDNERLQTSHEQRIQASLGEVEALAKANVDLKKAVATLRAAE